MRLRFQLALFTVCLIAAGEGRGSVGDLVALVRKELGQHRGDSRIAKDIAKTVLLERLDDRTIEALQSEGAGPETVAVLLAMRDGSERLRPPKTPAIPQPPAPSAAQQVQIWDAAHDNAVHYTENLPDFICSELVRRYVNGNSRNSWKLQDTLTLKLSYFEHREDYKLIMVNNRSTGLSYEQMRGAITEGEFGSMLAAIFALRSRTNREWDHWTTLRSRPTHVFTFAIARANSDYRITSGTSLHDQAQVKVGRHGYVYIDDETKMVVRLSAVADEFPLGFDVQRVDLVLDYDFTEVGGNRYLLPLHSETKLLAPPFQHRNETEFREYRKFSSAATITYDGVKK